MIEQTPPLKDEQIAEAVGRLKDDIDSLCDGEINAQSVRVSDRGPDDWSIRYVGDTGRDLTALLSAYEALQVENENLRAGQERYRAAWESAQSEREGEVERWHTAFEIAHEQAMANGARANTAETEADSLRAIIAAHEVAR